MFFPIEWVKSIWESEFTEIPELEGGVSEDLQDTARLVGTLSDLQTTLHGWTDDQEQAGTICRSIESGCKIVTMEFFL